MPIPLVTEKPLDARGYFTIAWRQYLDSLDPGSVSSELQAQIDEINAALANLPAQLSLSGQFSVEVVQNGSNVGFWLRGDVNDPGATYYYGTDADGLKGWHALTAEAIPYDNATSGLTATDVQAAIDEVAAASPDLVFTRITSEGDIRVTGDNDLRITD